MKHLSVIRSMSTREGDLTRGRYYMLTGFVPNPNVVHPSYGSVVANQLEGQLAGLEIPPFVSVGGTSEGPGFLGMAYAPFQVGANGEVRDLNPLVEQERQAERFALLAEIEKRFAQGRRGSAAGEHAKVLEKTVSLMRSEQMRAFDVSQEPTKARERYGDSSFGRSCLLARRLVESGVPFVEVTLGGNGLGWDTHTDGFRQVKTLSEQLDAGWGTLMTELAERGLLDSTTILCIGEFGRTPAINNQGGRDHFPTAWSCTFAGGGIAGGQAYGTTTDDGMEVADNQVGIGDVLATLCQAVGVDPEDENETGRGRPIHIAEGTPIQEILV